MRSLVFTSFWFHVQDYWWTSFHVTSEIADFVATNFGVCFKICLLVFCQFLGFGLSDLVWSHVQDQLRMKIFPRMIDHLRFLDFIMGLWKGFTVESLYVYCCSLWNDLDMNWHVFGTLVCSILWCCLSVSLSPYTAIPCRKRNPSQISTT